MNIDFNILLAEEMEWAIIEKSKTDPAKDEFPMRCSIVGKDGTVERTSLKWNSPKEKHHAAHLLSLMCAIRKAQAAVVTTDVRTLNLDAFCRQFDLAFPTKDTIQDWSREERRIMKQYDNSYMNLPPELVDDMLSSFVYGPHVAMTRMTPYTIANGTYTFGPVQTLGADADSGVVMNLIPRWWGLQ